MKEAIDGEALEFADDDGELGGEVAGEVGRAEEKRSWTSRGGGRWKCRGGAQLRRWRRQRLHCFCSVLVLEW